MWLTCSKLVWYYDNYDQPTNHIDFIPHRTPARHKWINMVKIGIMVNWLPDSSKLKFHVVENWNWFVREKQTLCHTMITNCSLLSASLINYTSTYDYDSYDGTMQQMWSAVNTSDYPLTFHLIKLWLSWSSIDVRGALSPCFAGGPRICSYATEYYTEETAYDQWSSGYHEHETVRNCEIWTASYSCIQFV